MNGISEISELPTEALSHALNFLKPESLWKVCAFVCKSWRGMALGYFHEALSLDLTWVTGSDQLEFVLSCLRIGSQQFECPPKVGELRLGGPTVTASVLTQLDSMCVLRNLRSLDIDNKKLKNDELVSLLLCVELSRLRLNCQKLDNVGIMTVIPRHLTELDLSGCVKLDDRGVSQLSRACGPTLRSLSVATCFRVSNVGVGTIAQYCDSLTHLNLDRCIKVTNDGVSRLAVSLSTLTSLRLNNMPGLTSPGLIDIAHSANPIHTLELKGCGGIDDVGFMTLAQRKSSSLTRLDLSGLTAQGPDVGEDGAAALSLSSAGLRDALLRMPHLASLNLDMCRQLVDDELVVSLASSCGAHLRELGLRYCSALTDASMLALATHCPELRLLTVELCYNLTDQAFLALTNRCQALEVLNVRTCNKLTKATFEALARLPKLRTVQLSGVTGKKETSELVELIRNGRPNCDVRW